MKNIIAVAIILLFMSCGMFDNYKPETDIEMNDRGKFDVITYIWCGREIVAHKYNVDWRNNDVALEQLDSVRNVHKAWAESVIIILKKTNPQ